MIEVEKRSFVDENKYLELIEKLKSEGYFLKEQKQITYYFKGEIDFRIMFTKEFSKLWLKKGIIHDDAREEIEVKVDNQYRSELLRMLELLGYQVEIKWFRKRLEIDYQGYYLTIDHSAGYGYIVEIEKMVKDAALIDETKKELEDILISLGIEISSKEEFVNKYEDYKVNWSEYTKEVDYEQFLDS